MSESDQNSVELPVLDISQPLQTASLLSLAEACKKWGFFHITSHGITKDLYGRLCLLSKSLFSLPSDTKLKLGPFSSLKTSLYFRTVVQPVKVEPQPVEVRSKSNSYLPNIKC